MPSSLTYLQEYYPFHPISFLPFILFSILFYKWVFQRNTNLHLPPSPPKLPIIGNLHQLGKLPHRTLGTLSKKYGDLMLLYFGNRPTLVVSSARAAEEIMKTHDLIFANRPNLRFINRIFYDGNDVAFSSYGQKWRKMKSICVLQMLSNKKVQSFRSLREEEVALMIDKIKNNTGSVINLREMFMTLSSDVTCRAAIGKKYTDKTKNGGDFHHLFSELMDVMGATSVGDYIPFLGWIGRLTGLEGRVEIVRKQLDDFFEEVIQEHQIRVSVKQGLVNDIKDDKVQNVKDFVDVMLDAQRDNPEDLSRNYIKSLILDMFVAGTETSSTALEWAMIELIRHPKAMKKLQLEVRSIIKSNRRVTENDLENMKYLQAVIKETLRLHPPLPLLLFRESSQDVKIDKYEITAKTQVIINAWAIHQDPKFWHDPKDFKPERFLNNSLVVDFRGQHFQFIPFGAGRRGCPGVSYGFVNTELTIASLIYEFNWTIPEGREENTLVVAESAGITMRPQNPPIVIASPRVPCFAIENQFI